MMLLCRKCCRRFFISTLDLVDGYRLLERPEWSDSFPCVTPLCRGRAVRLDGNGTDLLDVSSYLVTRLSVNNFYRMISGGDGVPVTMDRVAKSMYGRKIVQVVGGQHNDHLLVERIVLDDGTTVHLAPSTQGACIYKIEEMDHGLDTQEPAGRGHQD